ncbi:MAG: VIT1/CCC1 transporter family protein, partial [Candidatus Acidiferrales bacterium]
SEMRREIEETVEIPDQEEEEVAKVFRGYGLAEEHVRPVVNAVCSDQKRWVDFMMRFELGLEEPEKTRAARSAGTIAFSYIVGGLVPLAPYMLLGHIFTALWVSVGVTLLALLVFGFIKAKFTDVSPVRGALQTTLVGGLAAAAAFFLARLVNMR